TLREVVNPSTKAYSMDFGINSMNSNWANSTLSGSTAQYYVPGAGAHGVTTNINTNATLSWLYPDFLSGRHLGNVNMLYVDGHAGAVSGNLAAEKFHFASGLRYDVDDNMYNIYKK